MTASIIFAGELVDHQLVASEEERDRIQAEHDQKLKELRATQRKLERSLAAHKADQERYGGLGERLDGEEGAHGKTKAELAAEKAMVASLTEELGRVRQSVIEAEARAAQIASNPPPAEPQPHAEPKRYKMKVVGREPNNRPRDLVFAPDEGGPKYRMRVVDRDVNMRPKNIVLEEWNESADGQ